ncbi:CHASE2 domain-containing protein [Pseudomonas sp. D(2018)]|uniref:CHASE2 domain-containing protein n=1 Tax=Pseudomonas sp. D(2018) TaxID=2502238 RepID=UPI001485B1E3|nr:CHASE2 domain-containing protein [Pseudomonas sp. D(2018)]
MSEHAGSTQWGALRWLCRLLQPLHSFLHNLPAAVAVASLVVIGHLHFRLLDTIDGYTYLTIANLSAVQAAAGRKPQPGVSVVLIDALTHETRYGERSPLNRCELLTDLDAIYKAKPKVVVIDFDLSPSPLVEQISKTQSHQKPPSRTELDCQEGLYRLIETQTATNTVLMEPFEMLVEASENKNREWKGRMAKTCDSKQNGRVCFGDPSLRLSYGLLTRFPCNNQGLAGQALKLSSPPSLPKCLKESKDTFELINPLQILLGLAPVPISSIRQQQALPPQASTVLNGVVFFGGGYGSSDTFLTPLGNLYGVEIHAAAYMSLQRPASDFDHYVSFALEILLALMFGMVIRACWKHYFDRRFSECPLPRQQSFLFVLLLSAAFISLVILSIIASLIILAAFDWWLTPLPIAVGMLIESFFSGAVHAGVDAGHDQRTNLLNSLLKTESRLPTSVRLRLRKELNQRPHHRQSVCDQFSHFVFLDFWKLWQRRAGRNKEATTLAGNKAAASLLLLRRLVWLGLLVWALIVIWLHH